MANSRASVDAPLPRTAIAVGVMVLVLLAGCALETETDALDAPDEIVDGSDSEEPNEPDQSEPLPFAWGTPSGRKLKATTYNMFSPGYKSLSATQISARLNSTADVLVATQADVIVLQEVDQGRPQTGSINMAVELERRMEARTGVTWYSAYAVGCTPWDGGSGGLAMLSSAPITGFRNLHLSGAAPGGRCDNYSRCRAPNPAYPWIPRNAVSGVTHGVTVVGAHLTAGSCTAATAVRREEAAVLRSQLDFTEPIILAGDMNDGDAFVNSYFSEFRNTSDAVGNTSTTSPVKLDHVLTWGGAFGLAQTAKSSGTTATSDHLAVSTEVSVARKPYRALDTRTTSRLAAGGTTCVKVTGRGGIPSSAKSIAINLTAVNPGANGYLVAYPKGSAKPATASSNFVAGQTSANGGMVGAGTNGEICIYAHSATDVVVDVNGYYSEDQDFAAIAAYRNLDTRSGNQPASGSTRCIKVAGRGGVPASAKAVSVKMSAVGPTGAGYLTAYRKGIARPDASTLNYIAGQNTANGALVEVGDGGEMCVYVHTAADIVVDVTGYFGDNSNYSPLAPVRSVDTREITRSWAGSTRCFKIAGRTNVPSTARGVATNITAVGPSANGFLVAFPNGDGRPSTSTLNYRQGVNRANNAMIRPGVGGRVCVYTNQATDYIIDVVGYSM